MLKRSEKQNQNLVRKVSLLNEATLKNTYVSEYAMDNYLGKNTKYPLFPQLFYRILV